MYEFDSRVRYSEVDHHGTMTVPALINYFSGLQYLPVGGSWNWYNSSEGREKSVAFILLAGDPESETGAW